MSTPRLEALAFDLASDGFARHELAVRQVVRAARAAHAPHISPTLVDILADRSEPEVARLRAFGTVAAALSHVTGVRADRDTAA